MNDPKTQHVTPITLRQAHWLDPRANPCPAIADSVNIPLSELRHRVHELPPRPTTIRVANTGVEAEGVLAWLLANGRLAELGSEFDNGEAGSRRLWSPNAFLEACIPLIPAGRALDLACGSGRDAVFLASLGFHVTAVDHLDDALALGRNLERRYLGVSDAIEWARGDLEKDAVTGKFDLVTCFSYLHRPILSNIADLLNPDGHFVFETFTSVHREKFGKPRTENFVLKPGELREFARDLNVVEYEEGWHEGRHTAQLWARNER